MNKSVMVTGAAGTVGHELLKQLIAFEPKEIIAIDNNESGLFFLLEEFNGNIKGYVGDITDKKFIERLMHQVDIVFHCAALKHVIIGERSPDSIVQTNIIGLQNMLDAALNNNVERFIFTSSDKAVNPTNVMGTSKLLGERLVTATNSKKKGQRTIFCSTRFGNVIGSNGSVLPIFKKQLSEGKPLTLTHKDMSRFIMTIEESARLILDSATLAKGGEVFVTKMPTIMIEDLAQAVIQLLGPVEGRDPKEVKIVEIGKKAGEKLYEELMSDEETTRAVELDEHFVVMPAFKGVYEDLSEEHLQHGKPVTDPYISSTQKHMSVAEIKQYLIDNNLI